ncbi:MFS transporter [Actinoplanes lobatus]|uniref:MFS transporter n=1 Tax=Actinoplanes lobatus TaxID=113568 RepID=A0A7W7HNC3_9ACTN|nr:MFS transporter [Actinoplanes lobatus]MBB4753397.1 putative MFS family arabinose efflux permease [Actinoplanes lobatus]GGN59987.1 MFS transporter [Actinoplanes lobatus]GIE37931.1 MFS transporter [Actinoplanes lobatus]
MSSATSGYSTLLRLPGAAAFFLAAAIGRIGIGMTGLSLIWLVHARTGSYGAAGLATAGFALAEALIGPQLARMIDRYGQTRVLPFALPAHGSAVLILLTADSAATLILAATCAGAVVPQLGALSAARWSHLLRFGGTREALSTAFSLESLANATAFLIGPAVATTLGAAGHAAVASALAAGLILAGGTALALQRGTAPEPIRIGTRGQLLGLGFLLLALSNLAVGIYFGTIGVAVSAYATGRGVPAAATGILLAASLSGLASGYLYGLRRHRAPAERRLVTVAAYMAATALLVPFAPSPVWMAVTVVLTEAAIPPTLVLLNVLTENSVHRGVLTQALTWNNSFSAAGSALAAPAAGHLADSVDTTAAFAPAPVAAVILLLLAVTIRHRSVRSGLT